MASSGNVIDLSKIDTSDEDEDEDMKNFMRKRKGNKRVISIVDDDDDSESDDCYTSSSALTNGKSKVDNLSSNSGSNVFKGFEYKDSSGSALSTQQQEMSSGEDSPQVFSRLKRKRTPSNKERGGAKLTPLLPNGFKNGYFTYEQAK